MVKKMFQRMASTMVLTGLRFATHTMVKRRSVKNRKKRTYKETVKTMKMLHGKIIEEERLNEDFTEGPNKVTTKASKRLVSAFVAQCDKREAEDFYLYVAQEWVKDLDNKYIKISIFFIFLFLGLYIGTIGLTQIFGGFGGTPAILIMLSLILSPIFRTFYALRGRGWRKWVLVVIHVLIFYGFFLFVLS